MDSFLTRAKRVIHRATQPPLPPGAHERVRLARMPRYVETVTELPGFLFRIPDGPSFLSSWEEIFDREIYDFNAGAGPVRILDCGANVGVSCLFFSRRFPEAKITAFEPDPKIFAYLQGNLASGGCRNVELLAQAVWSENTTLRFQSEGADAGRVDAGGGKGLIEIPAVRLRDFLTGPVDLLKLDIEGAETVVLKDIAPNLHWVRHLFVEYHSFAAKPQTLGEIVQLLTDGGFRLHFQPMFPAPRPFIEVPSHLGMDMQLNIFGWREAAAG
jgi:FkbM family methyltransferase